jgi:hypothetical protein
VSVFVNNKTGFSCSLTNKFGFAFANWAHAVDAILLTLAAAALGEPTDLHLMVEEI